MKKKGCSLYSFRLFTMLYSTSAVCSITLFSFLSSLVFNNRNENLTLISNNKISAKTLLD